VKGGNASRGSVGENRRVVKVLLIPLAIVAFVVFLLVLGAIGLAVALGVIWFFGRIVRLLAWPSRRARRRRTAASQG
jgi:Flp pilus assembly protein TadB